MTTYWGALTVGVGALAGYLGGQVLLGWLDRRRDDEGERDVAGSRHDM